jgi:hypothetical protein
MTPFVNPALSRANALEAAVGIEPTSRVLQTLAWATRLRRRGRQIGGRRVEATGPVRAGFARGAGRSPA